MEEKGVIVYEARDGQQVKLSFDNIKQYLVQGHPEMVTQQELMYFMGICKARGLNPFNKDCYLMKYSPRDNAAIIVARDYFRKQAKAQRDCKGWHSGVIVERNGEVVYSKGLMLEGDKLLGGWFKAQPEGWSEPFELEVNLNAYIKKTKEGNVTQFWQKDKQPMMIQKVAECQGLRNCWPGEFAQLYSPEEMGKADTFKEMEGIVSDAPQNKAEELTRKFSSGTPIPEETIITKSENVGNMDNAQTWIKSDGPLPTNIDEHILHNKILRLKMKGLDDFEEVHRNLIPQWHDGLKDVWNNKWKSLKGSSYFAKRVPDDPPFDVDPDPRDAGKTHEVPIPPEPQTYPDRPEPPDNPNGDVEEWDYNRQLNSYREILGNEMVDAKFAKWGFSADDTPRDKRGLVLKTFSGMVDSQNQ